MTRVEADKTEKNTIEKTEAASEEASLEAPLTTKDMVCCPLENEMTEAMVNDPDCNSVIKHDPAETNGDKVTHYNYRAVGGNETIRDTAYHDA